MVDNGFSSQPLKNTVLFWCIAIISISFNVLSIYLEPILVSWRWGSHADSQAQALSISVWPDRFHFMYSLAEKLLVWNCFLNSSSFLLSGGFILWFPTRNVRQPHRDIRPDHSTHSLAYCQRHETQGELKSYRGTIMKWGVSWGGV